MNFRRAARPESLFLFGLVQSLIPYFFWLIYGKNPFYDYNISYVPFLVMLVGYISFWLGAKTYAKKVIIRCYLFDVKKILKAGNIISIIVILQLAFAINLYGGVPILMYVMTDVTVDDINELQASSGFGQLGLLLISGFLLNAVILTRICIWHYLGMRNKIFTFIIIFISIITSVIAGKRQGLAISVVFVGIGLIIIFSDPLLYLFRRTRIRFAKLIVKSIYAFLLFSFILLFGYIGKIRGGESDISLELILGELVKYYELPLINFEHLYSIIGFGPYDFNLLTLLIGFIPYKWLIDLNLIKDMLVPLEPTAGYGFFGGIIYSFGILGVIIFSFFSGGLSRVIYNKSFYSFTFLLIYCQLSWTLIAAHTYNFILSAHFLWAPAALFVIFNYFAKIRSRYI
jgi:oligosaccharide repeat unit polymerase